MHEALIARCRQLMQERDHTGGLPLSRVTAVQYEAVCFALADQVPDLVEALEGKQPSPHLFGPFLFQAPTWTNGPAVNDTDAQAVLQRAHEAAQAIYGLLTQTGCHAMIEWCGVLSAYVEMLSEAVRQGADPLEINQHLPTQAEVPDHKVRYVMEKLGCQLKPFIRANPELWREAVERWFQG